MFEILRSDLQDLALGVTFLGTGGGGDPYATCGMVDRLLRRGSRVEIVGLCELRDEDLVVPLAMVGAPTIFTEKLPCESAGRHALRKLERVKDRSAAALIASEIGGSNGVFPMYVAAQVGLPVVDGDGMGRAFPESQMVTFNLAGVPAAPTVVVDEHGTSLVIEGHDAGRIESFVRSAVTTMGGCGCVADYPMTGRQARRSALPGSISLALNIGHTVRGAQRRRQDPFQALGRYLADEDGRRFADVIFSGKIVDVSKETKDGFVYGRVRIGSESDKSRSLEIRLKNEFLTAEVQGELVATVPDLICVLDRDTAAPIATENLRYGQRVNVFAVSAPEVLQSTHALEVVGPSAFGLETDFVPLGARAASPSHSTIHETRPGGNLK